MTDFHAYDHPLSVSPLVRHNSAVGICFLFLCTTDNQILSSRFIGIADFIIFNVLHKIKTFGDEIFQGSKGIEKKNNTTTMALFNVTPLVVVGKTIYDCACHYFISENFMNVLNLCGLWYCLVVLVTLENLRLVQLWKLEIKKIIR